MTRIPIAVATGLVLCGAGATAGAVAPAAGLARAKGGQVVPWSKVRPDDLGDKAVRYDDTGIRTIAPAPRPGVHPRIFFGPAELPAVRRRLETTRCGREIWKNILSWTHALRGTYDPEADYARPDRLKGGWGGLHGRVPLVRGGFDRDKATGRFTGRAYQALIAGDASVDPGYKMSVLALEAFRCLVEDDGDAARDLGKALATVVARERGSRKDEHPYRPAGGHNMALCYDFIFPWLTPRQRDAIREEIALGTHYHAHYGTFLAANATTSNWCTLDSFLPTTLLAIEGEDGFNALKYRGTVRAWRNFLTYGWYASGAGYEGHGKNYQFPDTLVAFARRGENLIHHPHVRAYATRFLPHSMQPFGHSFVQYDDWGGTGWDTVAGHKLFNAHDAIALKFLFPADQRVDWVFRNYVGEDYENVPVRPDGYNNAVLAWAILASDFDPANDDPARLGLGTTFFCGERGLLMTRSDWSADALYLHVHCRQDLGGHTHADRTSFALAGLGRLWGTIQTMAGGSTLGNCAETRFHNCVVIDDVGQARGGIPGKVVAFHDAPQATFLCADAKNVWDWQWAAREMKPGEPDPRLQQGWQKVASTPNDFRFTQGKEAHLRKPWYGKDHWLQPGKITGIAQRPHYPVRKAFRTAGLVRGKHPYALIIDDIQKDDRPHHYKWLMLASSDLEIAPGKLGYRFDPRQATGDITLSCRDSARNATDVREVRKGDRLLLVRVLECKQRQKGAPHAPPAVGYLQEFMAGIRWHQAGKRLVLPSWSVAPDYKVLLFPYRHGDELPVTRWNQARTALTVAWPDQRDELAFRTGPDGRTRLVMARDGKKVLAIE